MKDIRIEVENLGTGKANANGHIYPDSVIRASIEKHRGQDGKLIIPLVIHKNTSDTFGSRLISGVVNDIDVDNKTIDAVVFDDVKAPLLSDVNQFTIGLRGVITWVDRSDEGTTIKAFDIKCVDVIPQSTDTPKDSRINTKPSVKIYDEWLGTYYEKTFVDK